MVTLRQYHGEGLPIGLLAAGGYPFDPIHLGCRQGPFSKRQNRPSQSQVGSDLYQYLHHPRGHHHPISRVHQRALPQGADPELCIRLQVED